MERNPIDLQVSATTCMFGFSKGKKKKGSNQLLYLKSPSSGLLPVKFPQLASWKHFFPDPLDITNLFRYT